MALGSFLFYYFLVKTDKMKRKSLLLLSAISILVISGVEFLFENPSSAAPLKISEAGLANSKTVLQDDLTPYTISQGQHFCFPRIFKSRNKPERVSWLIRFDQNCNYDLKDNDQKDWNKLCGLFFNLFNPRENTVMIGWRWNLKTEKMELCAYYHVDGSREFTKSLLEVSLEETFTVEILVDYNAKEYAVILQRSSDGRRVEDRKAFRHDNETCWEVNTYFGGNRTAPQDVTILKGYYSH